MSGNDQRLSTILNGSELRITRLKFRHQAFVVFLNVTEVEVSIGPITIGLGLFLLVEPGQLDVSRGHEVVEDVEVGHALVGEDEQLVVGLLQDRHSLAVNFEFFAVESNLGLAAFLNVALLI